MPEVPPKNPKPVQYKVKHVPGAYFPARFSSGGNGGRLKVAFAFFTCKNPACQQHQRALEYRTTATQCAWCQQPWEKPPKVVPNPKWKEGDEFITI
jgi:hypothetical protein